ncbi:acylglycerol kinase, mitochondrial isoform X3 [Hydra vulgaris]|uniref:Acylglycerol kinase, mitochondrial isoform X3 n=1 Tax=Hydra vulgaris TaxID=6087 RepID=A0ABM4D5M5_HYDVU
MANKSVFYTVRKNKKKTLLGVAAFIYALNYGSQRYREYLIRRSFFIEAKLYGEEKCQPLDKPKRFYVILNPTAGNSKCKKLFQKNAAPIFHLAGMDVTYIQTSYEGHAKTLMNYFDPSVDGIIVAGGDGSLLEVVTGMLRQPLKTKISQIPVGFIPLGSHSNYIHKKLFGFDEIHVRSICKAAMAIVKGDTTKVSVMEIKADTKPVYAFSSIHLGVYKEMKEQIDRGRFWLLGPLKKYFTFLWRTTKDWPPEFSFGLETDGVAVSTELSNLSLYLEGDNDNASLLVQKTPTIFSKNDFIKYGWLWLKNDFAFVDNEKSEVLRVSKISINPLEDQRLSYDIDGEIFDGRPTDITVHSERVNMFCNNSL